MLLAVTSAPNGLAQDSVRRLWVQVVDSATGRPLKNVLETTAATDSPEVFLSYYRTDSTGRVAYSVPRGLPLILYLSCPMTRIDFPHRGRVIFSRVMRADSTADTPLTVPLTIDSTNCAEPPVATRIGKFRGHYTTGFESNGFSSCLPFEDLSHTAYALLPSDAAVEIDSSAIESFRRLSKHRGHGDRYYTTYYVRWSGTLTGPGRYGHMGMGTYELHITHVADVRTPRPGDCDR
jgi:hypothetical protein